MKERWRRDRNWYSAINELDWTGVSISRTDPRYQVVSERAKKIYEERYKDADAQEDYFEAKAEVDLVYAVVD